MHRQEDTAPSDLTQVADESLVGLLRGGGPDGHRARSELFSRYYASMDARIRSVLLSYGWNYEPSAAYYNTLFFALCEQALSEETLSRFDPDRGSFRTWLLGVLVPHAVVDWLRTQRPTPPTGRQASRVDHPLLRESDHGRTPEIRAALGDLPISLRSMVELVCCAHRDVTSESVAFMATSSGQEEQAVSDAIGRLAERVRARQDVLSEEGLSEQLAVIESLEQYQARRADQARRALQELGASLTTLDAAEAACDGLTLKALQESRRGLAQRGRVSQRLSAKLALQEAVLRLRRTTARRERLQARYRNHICAATPTYEELAQVLAVPTGTLAARLSRAKKALEERLPHLIRSPKPLPT